jgi:hypothetical protein
MLRTLLQAMLYRVRATHAAIAEPRTDEPNGPCAERVAS